MEWVRQNVPPHRGGNEEVTCFFIVETPPDHITAARDIDVLENVRNSAVDKQRRCGKGQTSRMAIFSWK